MDRAWGEHRYTTTFIESIEEGWGGLQLERVESPTAAPTAVARVIFWDATGQYFVETRGTDIPLGIMEELIAETTRRIGVAPFR